MSSSRDQWLRKAPSRATERLRKIITLPAFSANCGRRTSCLQTLSFGTAVTMPTSGIVVTNAGYTVEFWAKLINRNTAGAKLFAKENGGIYSVYMSINGGGTIDFQVYDTAFASVTIATGITPIYGVWTHYAFSRSKTGGVTTISFYVNGVKVFTGTNGALLGDFGTDFTLTIAGSVSDGNLSAGSWGEMRFWLVAQADEDILQRYNHFVGIGYSALKALIPFNSAKNTALFLDIIGGNPANIANNSQQYFDEADHPPLVFGASFIARLFNIDNSGSKCSLKYPLVPPSNVNFGLCVSWAESSGEFKRRKLWSAGEDISPNPADYAGERLPSTFTLECWNIDGHATIDLTSNYTIETSITSQPNQANDYSVQNAGTVTGKSALASNYPLTFPLPSNVQQVY